MSDKFTDLAPQTLQMLLAASCCFLFFCSAVRKSGNAGDETNRNKELLFSGADATHCCHRCKNAIFWGMVGDRHDLILYERFQT
jgi:hypothetical protein